jgi:hypothetical protein
MDICVVSPGAIVNAAAVYIHIHIFEWLAIGLLEYLLPRFLKVFG